MALKPELYRKIESYLNKNFHPETELLKSRVAADICVEETQGFGEAEGSFKALIPSPPEASFLKSAAKKTSPKAERSLDDVLAQVEEPFSPMLFRLIREKNLEEVDIYKRAGIDRKLFSKIRCRDDYAPRKNTVLSLALAMELSLDETLDLLARAGYTLSHSCRSDLIVEYMISENIYDLFEVNEALYAFGLDPVS